MLGVEQIIGRILMERPEREWRLERIKRKKADKIRGYKPMQNK
jgi:hypothetical protein